MNNSRKSRAKPKHYEERKTFYRSDTRQPKLLDQVRNRIRCKHYIIRTEQAYIEWIRKFIFYHGKRHPAEMGENEIVEARVSRVREMCCFLRRESYFEAYAKTGTSTALYPF
ncbi:MAG: phage integrase N-terminal SAM-like domain-containing protein, partial [Desulfobacterales bacterium]|nr:phage integrase N-terminal SAM-like domain-containing protein [Desulfobacterales bacterium]